MCAAGHTSAGTLRAIPRGSSLGTLPKRCWFKCTLTMHFCFKHAGGKEEGQANVKVVCSSSTGLEMQHRERTRISVNLDLLQFSLCFGQFGHWSVLTSKALCHCSLTELAKPIMQTGNKYSNLHKFLQFIVELYLLCLGWWNIICQGMTYNVIYGVWEFFFKIQPKPT